MKALFLACLLLLFASGSATGTNVRMYNVTNIDTSKYAFIKFVKERDHYHFNGDFTPTTLTAEEIKKTDELFKAAVAKHAKESKNFPQSVKRYHAQIIAAINSHGEKVVWINCFCRSPKEFPDWKTRPVLVMDGGACFFNITINLNTGKDYNFVVNGFA